MVAVIIGVVFIIGAGVLFFIQKSQKDKAYSLRVAKSATTAELQQMSRSIAQEIGGGNWRDYVKVFGTIQCDRPLTSELKQQPCVYYKMEVRREYEETVTKRDSEGKSYRETQRSSEVLSSNQQSVPFYVQDAQGKIEVNPEKADLDLIKVLDEFRQEQAAGGMLSFGGFSLALGSLQSGRRTLGYHYSEWILPMDRKALVVGTVSDETGHLVLQKPAEPGKKFIISLKTDEELTRATDKNAQNAFYGMVACGVLGVILVLIGLVAG